jgi:hypothetical protein
MLNIREIKGMAKVTLNGKYVGGLWTFPWELNITNYIKSGVNTL